MLFSRGLALCLSATVAGVVVQPMRPITVRGESMSPTYASGSILWTTPVDRPLQRGDVVIAETSEGRVIKRIAFLPGDFRLQWKGRTTWEDLTTCPLPKTAASRRRLRTLDVPKGMVFLLGDNLERSIDSRSFGPVPIEQIRRLVIDQRSPDSRSGIELGFPKGWLAMGIRGERLPSHCAAGTVLPNSESYPTNL